MKTKFLNADYLLRFVVSIIGNFQSTVDAEDSFIIPPSSFDEDKPLILMNIPFCGKNKNKSKDFYEKNPPFHK